MNTESMKAFDERRSLRSASIDPQPAINNSLSSGRSASSVRMHAGRTTSLNSTVPSNSINAISFFLRDSE